MNKMNERQQKILNIVIDKNKISVAALAKEAGVSVVTIRHDLNYLEQESCLKRIHGYAVAINSEDVETRLMTNLIEKKSLAEHAASLVEDGETIFIESGSANALLAQILGEKENITLITVSSYIAHLLRSSKCEVILLGGIYQKKSESMVGPLTRNNLKQVYFSKAFIGIDGFHQETGFTGRDMMRADIVNTALQKCSENIILTDSSKFGIIHSNPLGPTELFSQVITDNDLSDEYVSILEENSVKVTRV